MDSHLFITIIIRNFRLLPEKLLEMIVMQPDYMMYSGQMAIHLIYTVHHLVDSLRLLLI